MADVITETKSSFSKGNMIMLKFACTAAADGSFTPKVSSFATGGYLTRVIIDPGAVAPQASWDLVITDSTGVDLLGGKGLDQSATVTVETPPYYSSASLYGDKPFCGPLTLTITANNVNGALIDIYIFVRLYD
jgi:hypothetical protein